MWRRSWILIISLLALGVASTQATSSGPVTIQFTADAYPVGEGDGQATIAVVRLGDASGTVGVHVQTQGIPAAQGGATANRDYTPVSRDLSFPPGVTQVDFQVPIIDDALPEATESVNLLLSAPTGGATLGRPSTAVLLIADNEPPTISFAAASLAGAPFFAPVRTVAETNVDQTAVAIRSGRTDVAVSVDFRGVDGTALSGTDYVISNRTVNFAAGQTNQNVSFHINARPGFQGDRQFYLQLLNPQPSGVRLTRSVVPVVILESESPAQPQQTAKLILVNGTVVTAKLGGAGALAVTPIDGASHGVNDNDLTVAISGADATTSLSLSIQPGAASPRQINIDSLVSGGGLGSLNLKSASITGAGLFVGGPVGSLTIYDILNGAPVLIGGASNETTTIKAHVIGDNSVIDVGSAIAGLTAANIGQSTIIAPSLAKLSVKGDKTVGGAGNCDADFELSGDGVAAGGLTLGKVTVGNAIANATFNVNGSIGSISVAQITGSDIFAGFTAGNPTNAFVGGAFLPGLAIGSVTTKAATDSFVDSVIAAAQVGTVKLSSLHTNNNGRVCGVLAAESIGAVSCKSPAFQWDPAGGGDQSLGNFHVKH